MPHPLTENLMPGIVFKTPVISELKSEFYDRFNVRIFLLRLDEIHPLISGNKLFKLYYFLKEAKDCSEKKIITFGGAYSNHLAATAFACKKMNVKCIGIVRGEKPKTLSSTLIFCMDQQMQLEYADRDQYRKINEKEFLTGLKKKYGDPIIIPEGGFSTKGKEGASLITELFGGKNFSHVCIPVGTATTFAGVIDGAISGTEVIGFGVLKDLTDIGSRLRQLQVGCDKKYKFNGDYHFGGYAKKTNELILFMNTFYHQHKIPLDFVYTAKMMYGVNDLIGKKYFEQGAKILCIHTGGLQGNNSLHAGTLVY